MQYNHTHDTIGIHKVADNTKLVVNKHMCTILFVSENTFVK